ncbi:protein-glutamate O-methyltransferase CheR [Thiotrichales bacterium 19X7-9]|nr:protein-glutamate O-methyltransferase CheR [Thiotrichales bacterium 19X7-9]
MIERNDIEIVEVDLLLHAIEKAYGYDFRHYAKSSLKRRLNLFMDNYQITSYIHLTDIILHNSNLFEELLKHLSITVTAMFRDPLFYRSFKENILPVLKTYPFVKIWSAGCATGEEIYSLAILLHEEGFLEKTTLYATDFNNQALNIAKKGIYSTEHMKKFIDNYNQFGGRESFSNYYTAKYDAIKLHDFLKDSIAFANHNLVTDRSFGEMNVILCRNVMIYFDNDLTNKVLSLFKHSLCHRGFLCIGTKETLQFSQVENDFDVIDKQMKIYQKR